MRQAWIVWILGIIVVPALAGCGSTPVPEKAASTSFKNATDPLSEQELHKFLRLVSRLPDGKVPEFTPSTQPELDLQLPAKILVSEFRTRFRFLCDPRRQGEAWSKDRELVKSAQLEGWTTAQLAAFMRCLSCAVIKSKLATKHNLTEIETRCREEITRMVKILDQDDERPRSTMDDAFQNQREVKVQRLGRMVALLEFTLQIKPVPQANVALIQQHASDIQGLLPKAALQDPFATAFENAVDASSEESGDEGAIVPVGYQTPRHARGRK